METNVLEMQKRAKKEKNKTQWSTLNVILLAILILYAVSMITLYVWGVFTSLKTRSDFYDNKFGLPKGYIWEWAWSNFKTIIDNFVVYSINSNGEKIGTTIVGQIYNTLMYAGVGAIIVTMVPCVVAYVTAQYKFKFSFFIYTLVIVTMVIPIIGNTSSMLLFLHNTGLYDTFLGTYVMKFHFGGMYFLVFYAAFSTISKEFYEAATLDGASEMNVMVRIMIPLVKSTIYTVILIQFIALWNDYNVALMFLPSKPTLAYGVYYLSVSNEEGLSSAPMRMACCMLTATPILIVFILFRNKIMGNITMGGVKE